MQITNQFIVALFLVLTSTNLSQSVELDNDKQLRNLNSYTYSVRETTVIGTPGSYTVQEDDTFLDIARKHELGINEMTTLYPQIDPWMPPFGKNLSIPSFWVLPPTKMKQLVINIPEMRLYYFEKESSKVQTYPIGIGSSGFETPEGNFAITEKRTNPNWYVPKSLQEEYGVSVMPPGPDNPLGKYVMKFSNSSYAMHGTHMPWGVGRLVSHGCIRCYPEHISLLYRQISLGTKVEIIYEPIKFGLKDNRIYVEVHPDVYGQISDFEQYAASSLKTYRYSNHVDEERYNLAVLFKSGLPIDVTLYLKNNKKDLPEKEPFSGGRKAHIGNKDQHVIQTEELVAKGIDRPIKKD